MNELLLVEEHPGRGRALQTALEIEGFSVRVAPDAQSGLALVLRLHPRLVIVDLTLQGQQGYHLVRLLRDTDHHVPIVAIATPNDQAGLLDAFRSGADDCVSRPVDGAELAARIEALLRRMPAEPRGLSATPVRLGPTTIWPSMRVASRADRPLAFRPREFDLLLALVMRRGRIVTRPELLRTVWGWYPDTATHTVDIHVSRLRRQIEPEPREPRYILTVRATGFLIPHERALSASA